MNILEERDNGIIEAVRAKYGTVIDIEKNPRALIEILQRFGGVMDGDAGTLPGGVPPTPPDPCKVKDLGPTLDDVMHQLKQMHRDMVEIRTQLSRPQRS